MTGAELLRGLVALLALLALSVVLVALETDRGAINRGALRSEP